MSSPPGLAATRAGDASFQLRRAGGCHACASGSASRTNPDRSRPYCPSVTSASLISYRPRFCALASIPARMRR